MTTGVEAAGPRPPSRGQNQAGYRACQVASNLQEDKVRPAHPSRTFQRSFSSVFRQATEPPTFPARMQEPLCAPFRGLGVADMPALGGSRRKDGGTSSHKERLHLPSNWLYPMLASMFYCQVLSWGE